MSLHIPSNKKDCPGFSPRQLSQRFPDNPFYEMVLPFHSKQPNPSNHSSYFILYCFRHNLRRTQAYKQKLSNDIVESHFQYVEWDRRQDDKSIQVFDRRVDRRYHADHFIQRQWTLTALYPTTPAVSRRCPNCLMKFVRSRTSWTL